MVTAEPPQEASPPHATRMATMTDIGLSRLSRLAIATALERLQGPDGRISSGREAIIEQTVRDVTDYYMDPDAGSAKDPEQAG